MPLASTESICAITMHMYKYTSKTTVRECLQKYRNRSVWWRAVVWKRWHAERWPLLKKQNTHLTNHRDLITIHIHARAHTLADAVGACRCVAIARMRDYLLCFGFDAAQLCSRCATYQIWPMNATNSWRNVRIECIN